MEDFHLIGTIDAKIDSKGRVFLPAVFRRALKCSENCRLIMRKDIFEDCLVLYTEEEWNLRMATLRKRLSVWSRAEQELFRRFVSEVEWIVLDSSGRFLIPKRYLQKANIMQDVTFVGMDRTIEIWNKSILNSTITNDSSLGDGLQKLMTENRDGE